MKRIELQHPNKGALGFYALFFLLIFALFPLKGSFIGNGDVIIHTAYFYEQYQWLLQKLGMVNFGNSFYPMSGIAPFMESYLGQSLIFWFFKIPGMNDVWAIYFLYVALCVLNAYSVYKLSAYYGAGFAASVFAGIVFAASCYMLGAVEFLNSISFFFIPFAMLFLERFFDEERPAFFVTAMLFLVVESYFSAYHTLMGGVLIGILFLVRVSKKHHLLQWKLLVLCLPAVILAVPIVIKVGGLWLNGGINPLLSMEDPYYRFSFQLNSFITSLPDNLIYGRMSITDNTAVKAVYRANFGIACFVLFLLGVFVKGRRRIFLLAAFLTALVISFGPHLYWHGHKVQMPLSLLYKVDFFATYFRMPGRAFVFCNLVIALFAGRALHALIRERGIAFRWAAALMMVAVFSLENLAVPPYVSDHTSLRSIPEGYGVIPDDAGPLTIADLPSSLFTGTGYIDGVNEFTREYRYQYWQTRHHHNTINGCGSYYPAVRLENNQRMMHIDREGSLDSLISVNGLDYIVFHKDLILRDEEKDMNEFLLSSPGVELAASNERTSVYKVLKGQ